MSVTTGHRKANASQTTRSIPGTLKTFASADPAPPISRTPMMDLMRYGSQPVLTDVEWMLTCLLGDSGRITSLDVCYPKTARVSAFRMCECPVPGHQVREDGDRTVLTIPMTMLTRFDPCVPVWVTLINDTPIEPLRATDVLLVVTTTRGKRATSDNIRVTRPQAVPL